MKVLWITGMPFGYHYNMMGMPDRSLQSGSWLQAAYDEIKQNRDIELSIATVANVPCISEGQVDNVKFFLLPIGGKSYNPESAYVIDSWNQLKAKVTPDILQIWGTESLYALSAVRAFDGISILVYMQGVMSMVYKHYNDGMPWSYCYRTFRDFYNRIVFKKQVKVEREILSRATGVIVENDWCKDQCLAINNDLAIYFNYLPIKAEYYNAQWDNDNYIKHTILTNAGGYPIKGHHTLFKALAIVKKKYPDVKLLVPGVPLSDFSSFKRKVGYTIYLNHLIQKYDLTSNIEYIGVLSAKEMANRLSQIHVYVMPSMLENHSASLIEALLVGTPCISSMVGGVISLINHKSNGLLYNSLDEGSLAGNIIRLFEDEQLLQDMAKTAAELKTTRLRNFGEQMVNIYKTI